LDPVPEFLVFPHGEDEAGLVRLLAVANHNGAGDALDHHAPSPAVAREFEFPPIAFLFGHCFALSSCPFPRDLPGKTTIGHAVTRQGSLSVRVEYGGGSVISFEVLGEVTARRDAWTARLSTQQQHLLAALVLGEGAPLTRERLEAILWDFRPPYPEKGIARVAHEVRDILREAAPGTDLVPSSHGGYRLLMEPEKADILRFRASADKALRTSGPDSAQHMRQALAEWGPSASGLHGGSPLEGLPGQWADSNRHQLRNRYRDAVIHCLAYRMSCHDYAPVLAECEQRAAAPDPDSAPVLLDEEFVGLWILGAAHAGDLARARTIYQRAQDAAEHAGVRLGPSLRELGTRLRDNGAALAVPAGSPQSTSAITDQGQGPTMEHVAGEDEKERSATGRPSGGQPGSVFNGDVYLNITGLPAGDTSGMQAQFITAHDHGTAIGVQGGSIHYYQGVPKHLPLVPGTGDGNSPEGRAESA
jgi:DNA-binding SARP family transcriptional activator